MLSVYPEIRVRSTRKNHNTNGEIDMDTEKKAWTGNLKKWLVLFGIPLIMLIAGAWQWTRADGAISPDAQIAEYEQVIRELDAIQVENPRTNAFVKDSKGRSVAVSQVKSDYQQAIRELKAGGLNSTTRSLQPILALCTMVFSVLALLWTSLGVFYQQRMGKLALQSREQLLATFEKGRKLLPTYMVVMVLLLFAAAIPLLSYEVLPILRHSRYSKGDMKIILLLVGVVLFLFYSGGKVLWDVWKASRKPMENEPIDVMGQALNRTQAPELWAFVDRVASKTGAGMPDTIVVGLNEGFFVTEHPVKLSSGTLVPQGRVLYLPLPYMAFLNAAEVAAVIGHELGHFIGADTVYSQRFSPIYSATVKHIVAISGGEQYEESWLDILRKPATLFGEMFLGSFHEAVRFWSRKRELAADAVGASVVNANAIASSPLRITALEPHVSEALEAHWDQGQTVEGGVLGHVRQLVHTKGMTDPSEHLQNRQSHPTDTHPELAVRLEALGLGVTPELLQRAMDPQASRLLQEFGLEQGNTASVRTTTTSAAPAPVIDISSSLQQELTGVAAAQRAEKVAELTSLVQAAQAPVVVNEQVWKVIAITAVIAVFTLGVGLALLLKTGGKSDNMLIGAGLLAIGVLAVVWMVYLWKRGKQAAMVVRADGLLLFQNPDVLPWSAIDDFAFTESNHMFIVRMDLDKAASAPQLGVSKFRADYRKKKHQLTVNLMGFSSKRGEKLMETILGHWRAYYAKKELERMGVQL